MFDRRTMIAGTIAAAGSMALPTPSAAQMDTLGAVKASPPPPGIAGLKLRYAFSVSVFFKERIRIQSDAGRVFVPVIGGEIWGPRLQGRIVPYGGADYAGSHGLDASYMLEAADGAMIYIHNRGYMKRLDGSKAPRIPGRPRAAGEAPNQNFVAPPDSQVPLRMRLAPVFDAPKGPHEWLSRTVIVGHGGRYTDPDHTIFTYYEVL